MMRELEPERGSDAESTAEGGVLLALATRFVRGSRSLVTRSMARGLRERSHRPSARETKATERISVIVPIHDAPEVTDLCLRSLEAYGHEAEVILIDDGSKREETVAIIDDSVARNPQFKLIRHESARGHSRSCEAGAALSRREFICLLNSDAVITPYSWAGVMDVFDAHPKAAIVGPMTSLATTAQQISIANTNRFDWSPAQIDEFARRYTNAFSRRWLEPLLGRPVFPGVFVNGFAFFIRRSIWDEFGGFPKELDDYGNETVMCKHAAQLGYELLVTRRSYVHHFGSQSYGVEGSEKWNARRRKSLEVARELIAKGPRSSVGSPE